MWCLAAGLAGGGCFDESSASGSRSIVVSDGANAEPAALMPDVVCMDLQDAQDLIQESGVFYSRSVDATGEGRRQIRDSNWVVVGQEPAAGAAIGEGEAELSVVKDDEPSGCSSAAGDELAAPPPTTIARTTVAPPTTTIPPTTVATTTTTTTTLPPTTAATTTTTMAPPPPPPTTTLAVQPFFPASECDPNYEGACVPIASDVDCAGGSGNGPAYVQGPVYVIGSDIYGLDGNDNDGVGCES